MRRRLRFLRMRTLRLVPDQSPESVLHRQLQGSLRCSAPPCRRPSRLALGCLAWLLALGLVDAASAETWRGLTVAPEHRCAPYTKKLDYPSPIPSRSSATSSVSLGAVYGPYTGTCFASAPETDIEHIVAASEAHDSGLCARDAATKARFARDLRNLTLASPRLNRHQKSGKDAPSGSRSGTGAGLQLASSRSAGLRAHDRSARSGGARSNLRCLREYGA